jgi:hypothetical protein
MLPDDGAALHDMVGPDLAVTPHCALATLVQQQIELRL